LGQFSLQVTLTIENQTGAQVEDVEIIIITANSGVFVTEAGQSSVYTGILNKESVLEASQQESIPTSAVHNMIGGKLFTTGASAALGKMIRHHMKKAHGGSLAGVAAAGQRMSGGGSGRGALTGLY
jgi:hypothetical protein